MSRAPLSRPGLMPGRKGRPSPPLRSGLSRPPAAGRLRTAAPAAWRPAPLGRPTARAGGQK
eukprot:6110024-Alexandrium_andersonii.AAC.1